MILVIRKKTGWASDDKKYPTGLLVRKKKTNELLVWLSKLIQYPGKEETGGLNNRKKDTWLGPTQPIRVGVDNECATTFGGRKKIPNRIFVRQFLW